MTGLGIDCMKKGNIYFLTNSIDYKGRVCGIDANLTDLPSLYYVGIHGTGVCVKDCPQATNLTQIYACVDSSDIPKAFQIAGARDSEILVAGGYCQYAIQSIEVMNYCVFQDPAIQNAVSNAVNTNYLVEFVNDIWKTRNYIFGFGFAVSLVVSFLYLIFIRIPGVMHIMVWGIILVIFVALIGLGAYLWETATHWDYGGTKSKDYILGLKVFGGILLVAGILWALLVLFMRKRILLAESVSKQAARCMFSMPIIVLYPLLQVAGLVIFMIPWVVYLLYLASMGEYTIIETGTFQTKVYHYSKDQQYRFWFLVFCYYWTTEFIVALGQITVALCASTWYFTASENKHTIGNGTVIASVLKAIWFHCGTAAFGSLIIAIVKTIRAFLTYLQAKAKKSKGRKTDC